MILSKPNYYQIKLKTSLACLFFLFLAFGQVLKKPTITYPFVTWSMYSLKYPGQTFHEFEIRLNNNTVRSYPFEIITFRENRAFVRKMRNKFIEAQLRNDYSSFNRNIESLIEVYENEFDQKIDKLYIYSVYIRLNDQRNGYDLLRSKEYEFVADI